MNRGLFWLKVSFFHLVNIEKLEMFIVLLHQHFHHVSLLETLNLFIDQCEAELGQPAANMARLCFSARSCSKPKNPIPIQAQKRLLSKGGPPEVTVTCLHPEHYWWLHRKRDERGGAVCVHKLFMLCFIDIFEDMFAKLRGNDLMLFGTELIQETAKWCSGLMPVAYRLEAIAPWEPSG